MSDYERERETEEAENDRGTIKGCGPECIADIFPPTDTADSREHDNCPDTPKVIKVPQVCLDMLADAFAAQYPDDEAIKFFNLEAALPTECFTDNQKRCTGADFGGVRLELRKPVTYNLDASDESQFQAREM